MTNPVEKDTRQANITSIERNIESDESMCLSGGVDSCAKPQPGNWRAAVVTSRRLAHAVLPAAGRKLCACYNLHTARSRVLLDEPLVVGETRQPHFRWQILRLCWR